MALIRGYIAASIDGYIADASGGVGWLAEFDDVDTGYDAFWAEIGCVVMGRLTYRHIGQLTESWPYAGRRGIVLSSTPIDDLPQGVTVWDGPFDALVAELRRGADGDVWAVGGGKLLAGLLNAGALDCLALFVVPVVLGAGIPLFGEGTGTARLTLQATEVFDRGLVRLDYSAA